MESSGELIFNFQPQDIGMDRSRISGDNHGVNLIQYKNAKKSLDFFDGFLYPPSAILFSARRAYHQPRKEGDHDGPAIIRILAKFFVDGRAEATDARECVFALLGMAKGTNELGLVANYDNSISMIIAHTKAAHAIIGAGNVDLLALCHHRQGFNKRRKVKTDAPSRVPDWLNRITRPGRFLPLETKFAALGNTPFEKPPSFERFC